MAVDPNARRASAALLLAGPLVAFVLSAALGSAYVHFVVQAWGKQRKAVVTEVAVAQATALGRRIWRSLSGALILGAEVRIHKGTLPEFEERARSILNTVGGITNLQLAPDGIVRSIYPLPGQEKAIGHDILHDDRRAAEAWQAVRTHQMTLAGPFQLIQGGVAVIGRFPVYLDTPGAGEHFWGFTSALIMLDDLLASSDLYLLPRKGYRYELSFFNAYSRRQELIAGQWLARNTADVVSRPIALPNQTWTLRVLSPTAGKSLPMYAGGLTLVALVSALLALFTYQLIRQRLRLELLVSQRTAELDQAIARQNALLEHTSDWVWEVDDKARYTYVSPMARQLLGYEPDEIIGRTPFDLMPEGEARRIAHLYDENTAKRAPFSMVETIHIAKDGRTVVLETSGVPVFGDDGAFRGYRGIDRDVTDRKRAQQALENQVSLVEGLLAAIPDPIFIKDCAGRFVGCNRTFEVAFGIDRAKLVGGTAQEVLDDADSAWWHDLDQQVLTLEQPQVQERRVQMPGGAARIFIFSEGLVRQAGGEPSGIVGILTDITTHRETEANLRLTMEVFKNASEGIMVTDPTGTIVLVNPAFSTVTGYAAAEVVGKTPAMLRSGRHDDVFYTALWRDLQAGGEWDGEIWNQRKSGEVYPAWLSIRAVHDQDGKIAFYAGIFSDISQRKADEQEIWKRANFDSLTGLPNRNLFQYRLTTALAHARRHRNKLALLFIDLDRFKWVNDTLGHHIGDDILKEAATRLSRSVRDDDTIARLGGDEFTILVSDPQTPNDVRRVATKILEALERPFTVSDQELFLTASIGVTMYPADADSPEGLLRNADTAMYRAKESGRNQWRFFTSDMKQHAVERLETEQALRSALPPNGGFELFVQPIVRLSDGDIVGAESLIRWHHPTKGLVAPDHFIGVAEDSGLIDQIGAWVVDAACDHLARLRRDGFRGHLTCNISGVQLRNPRWLPQVREQLERRPELARNLVLEFTESALFDCPPETDEHFKHLKAIGVRLALDDFGTGYSSLNYLRRFAIDIVKIDRSFIEHAATCDEDARIVEALVAFTLRLGLDVVAEGIEDAATVDFLQNLGCQGGQGYYFGEPTDIEQFRRLLRARARCDVN